MKCEFAASPYNRTTLQHMDIDYIVFMIDDQSFFELLLLRIRGATIPYSSHKKKEKNARKRQLENLISILDELVISSPQSTIFQEMLTNSKEELESIRKEEIKGLFMRTKAKWIEDGEKPTKYFCHLEKRNYVNKTVTKIIKNNNEVLIKQEDILQEIETFYRKLYSSRDEDLTEVYLNVIANFDDVSKLSDNCSSTLEGLLTYEEVLRAVKQQKNEKSPGTDGFSSEFFKFFWADIGKLLIRSLNYSFQSGHLSITQRQGIISIHPKGDKPREFLKKLAPYLPA